MPRSLGITSLQILGAIRANSGYGLEIVTRTGLPSGTVYPTLGRLKRSGLVTACWEDQRTAEREGRPRRRYYELTADGRRSLAEGASRVATLAADLSSPAIGDLAPRSKSQQGRRRRSSAGVGRSTGGEPIDSGGSAVPIGRSANRHRSPEMSDSSVRHSKWDDIPLETVKDDITRRVFTGDRMMIAHVHLDQGAVVPWHSHENEQLTYIVDGALRFWLGDEGSADYQELVVSSGEVLFIPSNVPHRAEALEDTFDLDVFSPPRQDWLDGTYSYFHDES